MSLSSLYRVRYRSWPWPCLVLTLPCLVLSCHCLAFELLRLVLVLSCLCLILIWPWPCLVLSLPSLVLSCHCLAFELFGLVFGLGLVSSTTWLTITPVESTIPCDTRVREGVGLRVRVQRRIECGFRCHGGMEAPFRGYPCQGLFFWPKQLGRRTLPRNNKGKLADKHKVEGDLKTERPTPKGKAPKPLFPYKNAGVKGKGLGEDKEGRTFSATKCEGQRGVTMRMD